MMFIALKGFYTAVIEIVVAGKRRFNILNL